MQITTENSKNQTIIITVEVAESDYVDNVNKVLEDYKKSSNTWISEGVKLQWGIKKQYQKPVLIDEINKLIQEELYKYISTQKIETLGSPLPIENNIDWDNSQILFLNMKLVLLKNGN